ncbi:MAG TPA: amidohydrolase family protein, partial [Acidimicrobiales bacterium]|nr:amidohydrolase family protein [Acidimicrobiales bacterium]
STDTHAGADLRDYKPYLESRWHEDFDAWAQTFDDPWDRYRVDGLKETAEEKGTHANWDSDLRVKTLEAEGVAAEVLYPNTIPPFFPTTGILIPQPKTQLEYDQRWAGLRAHNRWQLDFCSQVPGRRLGLAQIFLNNVDDAVAEARWARENGFVGLLAPSVSPDHPTVRGIWKEEYEPLWSVCEELELTVNQHAGSGAPDFDLEDPADRAISLYEIPFFSHRSLWHLILGGVFERHPRLRVAFTEEGAKWIPETLQTLDAIVHRFRWPGSTASSFGGDAAAKLSLLPSEYFHRQCGLATFLTRADVEARDTIGVPNLMWATDYPHQESTVPNSLAAMRKAFVGVPEAETREMLGMNAVRFYGLDEALLAEVAQRIGPSPAEVDTPLEQPPANPRTCPVFRDADYVGA